MFKKNTEEERLCHDYTKEKLAELVVGYKQSFKNLQNDFDNMLDDFKKSEKANDELRDLFANANQLYKEIKTRMTIDEYLALKNLFETDLGAQRTKTITFAPTSWSTDISISQG